MQVLPPEELVRWCQRTLPADPRAFEQLVAQYKQRVFARCYRLMGNPHDAEDQAQEVFLKVYRTIKTLDEPAGLTAWIDRITTNTCYDALAKQKSRPATMPFTPPEAEDEGESRYADTQLPGPEEAALRRELQQCLEAALSQLDTSGRVALVLRDIEDRPYNEIAELLGIGLSAVKMRIHRSRLAFQQLLELVCPDAWRGERSVARGATSPS